MEATAGQHFSHIAVTAVVDVVVVVPDPLQWKQQQDHTQLQQLGTWFLAWLGPEQRIIAYDINKIWKFDQSPRQNSFSGRILFSMRM